MKATVTLQDVENYKEEFFEKAQSMSSAKFCAVQKAFERENPGQEVIIGVTTANVGNTRYRLSQNVYNNAIQHFDDYAEGKISKHYLLEKVSFPLTVELIRDRS